MISLSPYCFQDSSLNQTWVRFHMVQAIGIEPMTRGSSILCSTSWATLVFLVREVGVEPTLYLTWLIYSQLPSPLSSLTHIWCERRDSNPHVIRQWILSPLCMPIPPLSHLAQKERFELSFMVLETIVLPLNYFCIWQIGRDLNPCTISRLAS